MTFKKISKRRSGFSLIEVLVAVVIMSVGLLALASLQLSMIRSSADTKAQTIAAGLAKDKIEALRSFRTLDAYRLLTTPVAGTVETLADSGGDQGGITFTRTSKLSRFVYDKASTVAKFVAMTNAQNTLSDTAIVALNDNDGTTAPQYVPGKDFKRLTVDVTWKDAAGQSRRVSMEDIVASLDPSESGTILSATASSSAPRKIEKKIADPSLDAMVIPIAVGGGSESAASNPKPVVTSGHDTVETRFDVYTYNAVNNGTANVQQIVETSVVYCSCTLASPPGNSVRGFRPTYWDGSRYAVPVTVDSTGAGSYSPPGSRDTTATQSGLCGPCCRDHLDPVGVTGAAFSPLLVTKNASDKITATTHSHFLANATGTAWSTPVANGKFSEACRLINVDDFWRVASDLANDHFKLLATKDLSNASYYASASVPDSTATTNYQGFVVDYLDTRFTTNTDNTTYNTLPSVSTLETTHSLGLPASVTLGTAFTGIPVAKVISGITQANPAVVTTSTAHTFVNGDRVTVTAVGGMTALNGNSYIIAGATSTTFQLVGVNSTTYPVYTSGGTATVNHGKWLHARGLYVDYLEKSAVDAITNAKTTCPSQSGSAYSDCVLRVLPFTSINLTEIADWLSSDTSKAAVTTADYSDSSTKPDPVRGKVSIVNGAVDATTVTVSSLSRKRNTGLLDLTVNAISAADNAQWNTSPAQVFTVSNPGPPPAAPDFFYTVLSLAPKTGLGVNYVTGASPSAPCSGYSALKANYPCQVLNQTLPTAGLGVANTMGVEVVGYNSSTPGGAINIPVNTSCTGPFSPKTYNAATGYGGATTYIPRSCSVYPTPTAVNTTTGVAAASTTVTNGSGQSAKTLFNFALITGDPDKAVLPDIDLITVTFGAPAVSAAPLTCTYTCSQGPNAGNTDCKNAPAKVLIAASTACAP